MLRPILTVATLAAMTAVTATALVAVTATVPTTVTAIATTATTATVSATAPVTATSAGKVDIVSQMARGATAQKGNADKEMEAGHVRAGILTLEKVMIGTVAVRPVTTMVIAGALAVAVQATTTAEVAVLAPVHLVATEDMMTDAQIVVNTGVRGRMIAVSINAVARLRPRLMTMIVISVQSSSSRSPPELRLGT